MITLRNGNDLDENSVTVWNSRPNVKPHSANAALHSVREHKQVLALLMTASSADFDLSWSGIFCFIVQLEILPR